MAQSRETRPARKRRYTAADYAEALRAARGLISVAARRLGVSRRAVYNAIERHKVVAEALDEARETVIDTAEGQLFMHVANGNLKAVMFLLRTLGKSRGYVDAREQRISGSLDLTRLTDEQLEALAAGKPLDG